MGEIPIKIPRVTHHVVRVPWRLGKLTVLSGLSKKSYVLYEIAVKRGDTMSKVWIARAGEGSCLIDEFVRGKEFNKLRRSAETAKCRSQMEPFLKWPGGKRWLAMRIATYIKSRLIGRYYEPFLGGGAVFFALRPRIATLSDINEDLINTYLQVRDIPDLLINKIRQLPVSKKAYYRIRGSHPSCPIERAVRFLYLNRTGFSGMYRLNMRGEFNVPYGGGERTPSPLWENNLLVAASTALRNRKILSADFECALGSAVAGDVVYCDPTYTVAHNYNGFVRYNERNFSWEDQERLAKAALQACERGVFVLVSNAGHGSISKLYHPIAPISLERNSLVSRDVNYRSVVKEYLFILEPQRRRIK